MYSINFNDIDFGNYGLLVRSHRLSLSRNVSSIQTQDRPWPGKGQGEAAIMTLEVYIAGYSREQALSRYSDIRGLLDQEDECVLKLDLYNDRYWMAQFNSLSDPVFVGKAALSATLIFTCYDRCAYSNDVESQQETLTTNVSASYGGTITAICFDDDYVYIVGATSNVVRKLDKLDLSLVATGPDYGGQINCICCDSANGYVYYGGDGGAGQYDMCKLLTSNMTTIVRGPDYGGIIYGCVQYGNFIYYGGNGGAGQYDISKLLKSDMTTEVRSADLGGVIYCLDANSTHVFVGHTDGAAHNHVGRYLVSDLSYVDESADYTAIIRALTLNSTGTSCYWCGDLDTVCRASVGAIGAATSSADLGSDLLDIVCDDTYLYVAGVDNVVYKLSASFSAGNSYVAKSSDYGGDIYALALDITNGRLYIGGATTLTCWKLDTRHLEVLESTSGDYGDLYNITMDDTFLYVASETNQRVYKFRKKDCAEVAKSIDFGSNCIAVTCDADYVYAAVTAGIIYKLAIEDLSVVSSYVSAITYSELCNDTTYLYAAGVNGFVYKITKSTMALALTGPDYTNIITCLAESGNYIYYGGGADGAGHYHLKRLLKTDMATIIESATFGGTIQDVVVDASGTYVYITGANPPGIIRKLTTAALAWVADSVNFWEALGIGISNGDVFTIDNVALRKWDTSLNLLAYTTSVTGINIIGDDAYVFGATTALVYKVDNRHLWVRSDHEVTIANDGTAKCDMMIGIIANAANYWPQVISNEDTGQEFTWEGDIAAGEELEIDSGLWYCTLEGVSAMAGVSGKWIQLAPGSNVLYIENVVGEFIIDWRPRYA